MNMVTPRRQGQVRFWAHLVVPRVVSFAVPQIPLKPLISQANRPLIDCAIRAVDFG